MRHKEGYNDHLQLLGLYVELSRLLTYLTAFSGFVQGD